MDIGTLIAIYVFGLMFTWYAVYRLAPKPTGQAEAVLTSLPSPIVAIVLYKMLTTLPFAILWPLAWGLIAWSTVRDLRRRRR